MQLNKKFVYDTVILTFTTSLCTFTIVHDHGLFMTDAKTYKCQSFIVFTSVKKGHCDENLERAFPIGHAVMKFKAQNVKLPVTNFDKLERQSSDEKRRHGALLPDTLSAIFCGPSNCGKTNALLTLIVHPNGFKFENIYVWSKSLHQGKYEFLRKVIENLEGVHYYPYSEHEEVVRPEDAKPQSLMIFDAVACEKQDNVRAYFCIGRHRHMTAFISVKRIAVYLNTWCVTMPISC